MLPLNLQVNIENEESKLKNCQCVPIKKIRMTRKKKPKKYSVTPGKMVLLDIDETRIETI